MDYFFISQGKDGHVNSTMIKSTTVLPLVLSLFFTWEKERQGMWESVSWGCVHAWYSVKASAVTKEP